MSQLAIEEHSLILFHHVHDHVLFLFFDLLLFGSDNISFSGTLVGLLPTSIVFSFKFICLNLHCIVFFHDHLLEFHHDTFAAFLFPSR